MPVYDYKCQKCGYLFEVEQKMSDPLLEFCPKCKGKVKRLISPVGIMFKGSGFYATDSATKSSTPQTKGAKPASVKKESHSATTGKETTTKS